MIKDFPHGARPSYELLNKGKQFIWSETEECGNSFKYIKDGLENAEMLVHPHFENQFILTTDASNHAVGFTLSREVDGEMLPILDGVEPCLRQSEIIALHR